MRTVEVRLGMSVPPATVIRAFTDPDQLRGWWHVERTHIQLHYGGIYSLAWGISETGIRYVSAGIITTYDPEGILHIDKCMYYSPDRPFLGPLKLLVNATPVDNGCEVYLCQGPYPEQAGADWDWYYDAVADAWPKVLQDLKKFLEDQKG